MRRDNSSYFGVFGNYVDENTRCWRVIQSGTTYPAYYLVSAGNRKAGSSMSIAVVNNATETSVNHKVHFHISYGRVETEADDGKTAVVTAENDGTEAFSDLNIAIGALKPTSNGYTLQGRFYGHFKIWRGTELIRDYVPVVRLFDGKAGFYDKVNNTFNPSIGSVDFVAGND